VPPASRANVEQTYFNEEFGAFYRINTGWITPLNEDQAQEDLFLKPYLNLVYYLQEAIVSGIAELNGINFTLDDFCYKPITGEGCIVESPMQYFKSNQETLNDPDVNPKTVAQCIPPPDQTERTCFDSIGTPVLTYAVFGGITCEEGTSGDCEACLIDASGL
jgi:Niemann-Pick C1 protein